LMGIGQEQLAALGLVFDAPPKITRNLEHGEKLNVGNLRFEVRHCPGHTRGHVVLVDAEGKNVIVGDCLFEGSIGRTDLPGGNYEQLMRSIEKTILSLEDDFLVHSGHGSETTVGRERQMNPFLTGQYAPKAGRYV